MRHPKLLAMRYASCNVVGVLSAKGSVDLYDFENSINLPDLPVWNNLKEVELPLYYSYKSNVDGPWENTYIRTAVGVTKAGEVLSYGNTTYHRDNFGPAENITVKETACSALSGMSGVDRLLVLYKGADYEQKHAYSVTAYFFKDGSAKAVLWYIYCYNGTVINKSSTVSFEGNDIVDIRAFPYNTRINDRLVFLFQI